jgi:transposase
MAISGDPNDGFRMYDFEVRSGTTTGNYLTFIWRLLAAIPPGNNQRRRCLIMDNLIVHHHPLVIASIYAAGHRICYRAPYHPVDGPIEYCFNSIESRLKARMNGIYDINDLTLAVQQIIRGNINFSNFFENCGYRG